MARPPLPAHDLDAHRAWVAETVAAPFRRPRELARDQGDRRQDDGRATTAEAPLTAVHRRWPSVQGNQSRRSVWHCTTTPTRTVW